MTSKPFYTSKTFLFNALTIIIAVASFYGFTPDQELTNQVAAYLVLLSPIINLILRYFTKKPITLIP